MMNDLHFREKYRLAGKLRHNQTVAQFLLVSLFLILLTLLSVGSLSATSPESNPFVFQKTNINTINTESNGLACVCTGSLADTEPPKINFRDVTLQGLGHGDTLLVDCGTQMDFDANSAWAMDNCDPNPRIEFVDYRFQSGDCHRDGFLKEIVCGWKAIDECGNRDSIVITFLVTDNTPPVFDPMPDTLTVECSNIDAYFPTATDDCSERVFINKDDWFMPGDCGGEAMIIRDWFVYDGCGNKDSAQQVLWVVDTQAPVITGVPDDMTLSCEQIVPDPAVVTVRDNCDNDVSLNLTIDTTGDDCRREIIRIWSSADDCGNMISHTQIITVVDTTAPAFVYMPADSIAVECDQSAVADPPIFKDNCDLSIAILVSYDSTAFDCGWRVDRTWTATDRCGNSTFFAQSIYGLDTTNPTFGSLPANETVECDNVSAPAVVTASDNCDLDVDVALSTDTLGTICNNLRIRRTWVATDNCGNQSTHTQMVNIEDTTIPSLMGVPADVTIECTEDPGNPVVTAADNCDPDPVVSLVENITGDDCFTYLERIYTATDHCGNAYSETQIITITDFTAPTIDFDHPDLVGVGNGGTVRYECTDVYTFTVNDVALTDNCDDNIDITINHTPTDSDDCSVDGYITSITSVWTATDNCGNATTRSVITEIIDTTDPVLVNVPADVTIGCQLPIPTPPTIDVTDNCDNSITVVLDERITGISCSQELIRTWTATDDCGNSTTGSQVITVIDTLAPVPVSVPGIVTIECSDPIPTDMPVFEDGCDNGVTITESQTRDDQDCGFTIVKVWTVTDDCGNRTSASQIINAVDTTNPTFDNAPGDATVACENIPDPANVTAFDNCDIDVEVTFSEQTFGTGDCGNWEVIRTWTATDDCGNQSVAQQILTISDDIDPVFTGVPGDVTIECDESLPVSADPTASDNCDNDVTITVADMRNPGSCPGEYVVLRTWTATDDCGNTSEATQTITALDRTAPVITFVHPFLVGHIDGDTITIQCDNLVLLDTEDAEATDNCSTPTLTFDEEVINSADCTRDGYFQILRCTWTAVDECGNTSSAAVIVVIKDDTAPVFTNVPPDANLNCGDSDPGMNDPTVTDNCDPNITFTFNEDITSGSCVGGQIITRTWTATDFCGNTTTVSQVVSFDDDTPPVVTFDDPQLVGVNSGDTIYVDCQNLIQFDVDAVNATDACDPIVDVVFDEDVINSTDCQADGYITQLFCTWTATDDCGNSTVLSILVRVTDNEAPVLQNIPDDITVECDDVIPAPANVTATDACAGQTMPVNITMTADSMPGRCPGALIITRIWTATDNCGNLATASQVITQEDTTAPIGTLDDPVLNVSCTDVPPIPTPNISDNCGVNPLIAYAENRIDGACAQSYTIERTWTITDGCANSSVLTQTINVTDDEAPMLSNVPADMVASCDNLPPVPTNIQPFDNCDPAPTVSFNEISSGTDCSSFAILREWTATDACGNSRTYTQRLTVTDSEAPTLSGVPADGTFDCQNVPPAADLIINDDCDPDPMVTFDESRQNGSCRGNYTLTRSWVVTDRCGNTASTQQVLTITDNTAPTVTLVIPDYGRVMNGETIQLECDSLPVLDADAVVVNDCDPLPTVTFDEIIQVSSDCRADGYLTLMECVWVASDDCGNQTTFRIFVEVVDNDAPTFSASPANDTIYLSSGQTIPAAANITATDECDMVGDVTLAEMEITLDDCSYNLIRLWTVTDNCGNTAAQSQILYVTDKVQITDTLVRAPGCGLSNGVLAVTPFGNPNDYTYRWTPDVGTPNTTGNERTNLPEGSYTIDISTTSNPSCVQTLSIQMVCDPLNVATDDIVSGERANPCEEVSQLFVQPAVNVANRDCQQLAAVCLDIDEDVLAEYDFLLDGARFDDQFVDCNQGQIALPLPTGQYEFTSLHIESGCRQMTQVGVYCLPTKEITATIAVAQTELVCIDLTSLPGNIQTMTSIMDSGNPNSVNYDVMADEQCLKVFGKEVGQTRICVVAVDDMGLTDTTFVNVDVRQINDMPELKAFNGFSPNGDQINDYFTFENLELYPNAKLTIFNSWGSVVYKSNNYQNDWDGTSNGNDLPDGVYFYVVEDESGASQTGYIQLLR